MTSLFCIALLQAHVTAPGASVEHVLTAIRMVESGGRANVVGDGGRAIGPYQIHYRYWKDSGVAGSWSQCHDRTYAEKVVRAYWKRYCPKALKTADAKTLARIHNGGPKGHVKTATLRYWKRVQRHLQRDAARRERMALASEALPRGSVGAVLRRR